MSILDIFRNSAKTRQTERQAPVDPITPFTLTDWTPNAAPQLSWFTSPKTLPTGLRRSFGPYNANAGVHGPAGTEVQPYTSAIAPAQAPGLGIVLSEARNRVGF